MKRFLTLSLLALITAMPLSAQTWIRGQQLTISPKSISLFVNQTETLKAFARTSASVPVARPGVVWASRDTSVVTIQSRTNDEADLAARDTGRVWVTATWTTRSGQFIDSVLVVVNGSVLGSLPWRPGQQLLLMPKFNTETVVLMERDSIFLQGIARTSQGILIADPLVQFQVDPAVGTIRRITNTTAMLVIGVRPANGIFDVRASWSTRSGVFRDTSRFIVERTPDPTDVAIENVIVMQSIQRPDNGATLVDNRQALLRVFLRGSLPGIASPLVRVQLLKNNVPYKTVFLTAASTVPIAQTPVVINSTWNLALDSLDMRGNLQVLVDLQGYTDASVENNVWPRSGTPFNLDIRKPVPLQIRFVPIFHAKSGLLGNVTPATIQSFLREFKLMFPYGEFTYDIRETYTTNADTLRSNDSNRAWLVALSETNSLRFTDGAPNTMYYVSVVKVNYGGGVAGYAYVPGRASIVWDAGGTRGRVTAHELGHNFGRRHVAACGSGNTDSNYPYAGGRIGNVGWNYMTNAMVDTTITDIMGYCNNQWISDYTWQASLNNRGFQQPSLLAEATLITDNIIQVSGRIQSDTTIVDATFRYTATPTLDDLPSPYRIQLYNVDTIVSVIPFTPVEIDHANELHFNVKSPLPLSQTLTKLEVWFNGTLLNTQTVTPQPQDSVSVIVNADNILSINWLGNWESALLIDVESGSVIAKLRNSGESAFSTKKNLAVILSRGLTNQTHLIRLR